MNIGLMWFSRDLPLAERIANAANYYKIKYGIMPNYCEVNPKDFADGEMPFEVKANRYILPYHLWIGVKT